MDVYTYYALCFLLFLFLFYRPIAKGMISFLDGKITEIKWEVESAIRSKEELEKQLAELKKDMPFVERKHKEMIESAKEEINREYKAKCKSLKSVLQFTEKASLQKIKQMEQNAVANVKSQILEKSLIIVSKYFADQKSSDLDLAIIANRLNRQ